MPSFKWTFLQFYTFDEGEKADIVSEIHWRCEAIGDGGTGLVDGRVKLGPHGDDFIPFEKLSEEWARAKILDQVPGAEKEAEARMEPPRPTVIAKRPPFVKDQ